MNRRAMLAVSSALATVALVHAQNPARQGQPTFTASTDVVMVDVSVRKGGKQVTGLTAVDFELRDNGVRQEVETVESQAVPIDLSILIDVSGNPDRPWVNLPLESQVAAEVDKRARQLTKLLRSGDRVRLFALSTYIQQLWPLQAANLQPATQHLDFDGMPSLYDSLLALLLQPVEPSRRHVVIAETKGLDSVSVTTAADLREVAAHSDSQAHFVMMERKADEEATVRVFQGRFMDLSRPAYRFWVPARHRLFSLSPLPVGGFIDQPGGLTAPQHDLSLDGRAIKDGADATGGGLYQTEGLAEPTLFNTFEKAFENFRQSYILRYSPRGVTRPGWHDITVTVPRDKSVQIKARSGYSIEAPGPAPTPAPAPALPAGTTLPRTSAEIAQAFGIGQFDLVTRSLRQTSDAGAVMRDFESAGNPWPAAPRREATLAIQVAEAGVFASLPAAREQGAALIRRFAFLVRDPISPDDFEREWLVAASRMLQGAMRPAVSQPFVENALQRFPYEPRLLLARAVISDQFWPRSGTVGTGTAVTRDSLPADVAATLSAQFDVAASFPGVRAEAQIRHGWFLHRIGRNADALAKIEGAAVDPSDRALAYLRELLTGQVLQAMDRGTDAIAAFRRAVALAPAAQEGRVALMNALLIAGDRDEAATLAAQIQSTPASVIDPWWMYWQGDYRRYPESLARLREMMK